LVGADGGNNIAEALAAVARSTMAVPKMDLHERDIYENERMN
jgi:hypothetical protein